MSFVEKILELDVDMDNMGIVYHDRTIVNFIGDMTPLNSLVFASTGTDRVTITGSGRLGTSCVIRCVSVARKTKTNIPS